MTPALVHTRASLLLFITDKTTTIQLRTLRFLLGPRTKRYMSMVSGYPDNRAGLSPTVPFELASSRGGSFSLYVEFNVVPSERFRPS